MNAIVIENLTRNYGNGKGVFDVSFSIKEGEVFGFLGPNGAGKTTTIRHLMGFLKAESGSLSINGLDCWQEREKIQGNLGYIPGEMAFFDDMNAEQFFRFILNYRKFKHSGRVNELCERFELDKKTPLKKMSKGMKQKTGIVTAFMHDPAVYILDEPTSGLDPLMQKRFIDLVEEEKKKKKTILMSSHIFEEVEKTCTSVAIIRQGRIAATESINELKIKQLKKYEVCFKTEQDARNFSVVFKDASVDGNKVTVTVSNNLQEFLAALNNFPVINLTAPVLSLEEIFMQYYGEAIQN